MNKAKNDAGFVGRSSCSSAKRVEPQAVSKTVSNVCVVLASNTVVTLSEKQLMGMTVFCDNKFIHNTRKVSIIVATTAQKHSHTSNCTISDTERYHLK